MSVEDLPPVDFADDRGWMDTPIVPDLTLDDLKALTAEKLHFMRNEIDSLYVKRDMWDHFNYLLSRLKT